MVDVAIVAFAFLFAFLCLCAYRTRANIMQYDHELRRGRLRWTFTLRIDDMYLLLGWRTR